MTGLRRYRKWTQESVDAIDWSCGDADLERRYGLKSGSVLRCYLISRGFKIPARTRGSRPTGITCESLNAYRKAGLGKESDAEVGRRLGVSRQAVGEFKRRLAAERAARKQARMKLR